MVIKPALILGQTNAESECSLLVNARVVTQDRTLLNEETIVGLRVIKEAIRLSDPYTINQRKLSLLKN